jgi:hypothetical protein
MRTPAKTSKIACAASRKPGKIGARKLDLSNLKLNTLPEAIGPRPVAPKAAGLSIVQ